MNKVEQQNERMRKWFKSRTGLKSDLLSDHMKEIDKIIQHQSSTETNNLQNNGTTNNNIIGIIRVCPDCIETKYDATYYCETCKDHGKVIIRPFCS